MNPWAQFNAFAWVRSSRRGGSVLGAEDYLSHWARSRLARGLGSTSARDQHLATTRPVEEAKCTNCTTTRTCSIDQIKGPYVPGPFLLHAPILEHAAHGAGACSPLATPNDSKFFSRPSQTPLLFFILFFCLLAFPTCPLTLRQGSSSGPPPHSGDSDPLSAASGAGPACWCKP